MDHAKYNTWEDVVSEYRTYTKRWNVSIELSMSFIFTINQPYELVASKLTVLSIIKAFFEEPFTTAYQYIQSPLLLLHATEPKELQHAREKGIAQIRKDIKNVTIVPLEDAGHMIQWDQPEEVSAEIVSWIEKNEERLFNE